MNGVRSGASLITLMQLAKDLQDAWIMFDHVKRVLSYITKTYHVYNPTYCKLMTIVVCDMQFEDTKT
jgi:hypothetical protein